MKPAFPFRPLVGMFLFSGALVVSIAACAAGEPCTENLPQPRAHWVEGLVSPPSSIDPRTVSQLPPDEDSGLETIPEGLFVVAPAHYSMGTASCTDGSVVFTEYNRRNVKRVTPDGRVSNVWIKSELFGRGGFYGVAADMQGSLFVACDSDTQNGGILRVLPDGHERFVVKGVNRPRQVSVDQHGDLYVVLESENRIVKWAHDTGTVETVVGSTETRCPQGVAVDIRGNIYFSEYGAIGPSVPSPDGLGLVGGVPTAAGCVKVKRVDGGLETVASPFWRARGLALHPSGSLILACEANAWDQSDSGSLFRITPETGKTERILGGIGYPQFPTVTPGGKIYVTLNMDDLLVCCDPEARFRECLWPERAAFVIRAHGSLWNARTPDAQGCRLRVRIEDITLDGVIERSNQSEPVSIWIRVPAERLELYRHELPYHFPERPTPGRYVLPEIACTAETGTVFAAAVPVRKHQGARWPMLTGYKGTPVQFTGREWPAEGFDDTPIAYLVYVQWRPV